jgi:putative hydrolase of the HAD superfamily
MIRAILFDLDDTLFDRAQVHRLYCLDFMDRHPAAFSEERREADLRILEGDRLRFARMVSLRFPAVGLSASKVMADQASNFARFVRPDPSVALLLATLRGRYRLAIVSNGSGRVQRAKLAKLGLGDPRLRAFISGELGVAKPGPALFRKAIDWVGCESREVLFVGDDPVRDIAGAFAVGMATCWVSAGRTYPWGLPAADLTINRVGELEEALA